jgi:hypothetical protein
MQQKQLFYGEMTGMATSIFLHKKYLIVPGQPFGSTETTVVTATGTQTGQSIIPDGMGGVFAVWEDPRIATGNREIYVQRINNSGAVQWTANGVNVSDPTNTYSGTQITPQIAPDRTGGVYVCWNDQRLGAADANIYAQRVDGSGVTQWASGGVAVCTAPNVQSNPLMINDGGTNAILCWGDNRVATNDRNFYAQKIDLTGAAVWPTANGVAISTATGNQPNNVTSSSGFNIVSDSAGGAIFIWDDARNTSSDQNIMAQKINASGAVQWTADGVPVSTKTGSNQRNPVSVSDNNGAAVIAWSDSRTSLNGEIYASRLFASGALPVEFITITAAQNKDLVAIAWKASCDNMTDRFVIEKSSDSRQFNAIGSVKANIVNGKCIADFAFNDMNLLNGTKLLSVLKELIRTVNSPTQPLQELQLMERVR